MSATSRGISDHETARMVEQAHMDLRRMGITGPIADRLMMIFIMGACGDTAEQARGAADRLFPVVATRLAGVPETPANCYETTELQAPKGTDNAAS